METFERVLTLIGFSRYIQPGIAVFVITMGMVYLFGRMLGVTKTHVGKNRVAAITVVVCSVSVGTDYVWSVIPKAIFDVAFLVGFGYMLYTLIGMRLASRVLTMQDKKLGKGAFDEGVPGKKKG